MEAHQLRIAIAIAIRHARGSKVASNMSYADAQKFYNPIAKANILEGAHGWRKDSLLRRGQRAEDVAKSLMRMKPEDGIHPSLTDFSRAAMAEGPVTKYACKQADSMVTSANRSGIEYDMLIGGLWNSAMLPGVGGDGLMDSSTEDFWYNLGRAKASAIKSGRYTLKMANGATNKKLTDLTKNLLKSGELQSADADVEGVGMEDFTGQSQVSDESIVTLLFDAIANPGKWHNRAKEWFAEHIGGRLSGTMLEVFEAYQHLGATPKGGIQGGYNAAADYVNEKREAKGEAPISPKGVKKAWEAIKKRFPDAFEDGLHDRKYNDLMKGLLDDHDMASGFFGGRGFGDKQYDESRMASIVKRHTYRQQLRLRKLASASTKTAITLYSPTPADYDWWAKNGRSFKSKITRAERVLRKDPKKALKAADAMFAIMEKHGYPDNWNRVKRLKENAIREIQISRMASTKTAGTHTFRMPGALPDNWKPSRYPRDFEMLYARDKKIGQYGQERYEKALKTWEQWKREGNPEAEKYDLAMIEKETIGYEKEKAYQNLYLELKAVFDKGDLRGLKERLWSANTFSKKLVSGWLGVKLPRTDKGTFAILDAQFGR